MVATVDSVSHTLALQATALLRSAHPEECDPPPEPPPLPTPVFSGPSVRLVAGDPLAGDGSSVL